MVFTSDHLQIGMYVDSYYRGNTEQTYPGNQGTEKLVIHQNFQRPMVSDMRSDILREEIFNNEDLTGPYSVVVDGYAILLCWDIHQFIFTIDVRRRKCHNKRVIQRNM